MKEPMILYTKHLAISLMLFLNTKEILESMNTLSSDTHLDAERLHIELLRKAPLFQKLQMVTSLVKTTCRLSWQGIRERYANETLERRRERFLFLLYKDAAMAKRVTTLLAQKEKADIK